MRGICVRSLAAEAAPAADKEEGEAADPSTDAAADALDKLSVGK